MAYDERSLVGVGGWLTLLIISLCAAGVIYLLYAIGIWNDWNTSTAPLDTAGTCYLVVLMAEYIGVALLFSYLAWRLFTQEDAATPSVVIAGMWIVALAIPLANALLATVAFDVPADEAAKILGRNVQRPLVFATIWSAYLMRSERVANTYSVRDPDYHAIF